MDAQDHSGWRADGHGFQVDVLFTDGKRQERRVLPFRDLAELPGLVQRALDEYERLDTQAAALPKKGDVIDLASVQPKPPTQDELDLAVFRARVNAYKAKKVAIDAGLSKDVEGLQAAYAAIKSAFKPDDTQYALALEGVVAP